jgi:hypothetical protein
MLDFIPLRLKLVSFPHGFDEFHFPFFQAFKSIGYRIPRPTNFATHQFQVMINGVGNTAVSVGFGPAERHLPEGIVMPVAILEIRRFLAFPVGGS